MQELRLDKFKLIAGHPSLEFVNTLSGYIRVKDEQGNFKYSIYGNKIEDYVDLASWARKVGILNDAQVKGLLKAAEKQPAEAKAVITRCLKLRGILYRVFMAAIRNRPPDSRDLDGLNRELLIARKHEEIAYSGTAFNWSRKYDGNSLDYILWEISRLAADLLTSDLLHKLRECVGETCGWLFLDRSRSGNRHWCDMKDCGNLAKVRRFRARNKNAVGA
jgi:predicted RNA-binding Zn ribbon-like protein